MEGHLKLTLNMDKTHITHVNDGFTFLGHRIIRKWGPRGMMRPVSTIPKEKSRGLARKLTAALSGNDHVNKIDMVETLNRQLAGWANFHQYTDYTAHVYQHLDRIVFWKLAHWLARKDKTSIKSLMRQYVKRPGEGRAKTWQLLVRSGTGIGVGSHCVGWSPVESSNFDRAVRLRNPYLISDPDRKTLTSRYREVTMAMTHA